MQASAVVTATLAVSSLPQTIVAIVVVSVGKRVTQFARSESARKWRQKEKFSRCLCRRLCRRMVALKADLCYAIVVRNANIKINFKK